MVFSSSLILLDLTEPVHVRHDSDLIMKVFSLSEPACPLYATYAMVGAKTHLIVNSNVMRQMDKGIYLHRPINSSSHTLP